METVSALVALATFLLSGVVLGVVVERERARRAQERAAYYGRHRASSLSAEEFRRAFDIPLD